MTPVILDRVRYWCGERTGKADGTGQVIDGPRWINGFGGPYRVVRVKLDSGGTEWIAETHVERELAGGAGVRGEA